MITPFWVLSNDIPVNIDWPACLVIVAITVLVEALITVFHFEREALIEGVIV